MSPPVEEAILIIDPLPATIDPLPAENTALKPQIADLTARLALPESARSTPAIKPSSQSARPNLDRTVTRSTIMGANANLPPASKRMP